MTYTQNFLFIVWFLMLAAPLGADQRSWPHVLDAAAEAEEGSAVAAVRKQIVEQARTIVKRGIMVRPHALKDIDHPDGRARNIKDPVQREIFALAMRDSSINPRLSRELPLVAAAARLTGEAEFLDHVQRQLKEMTTWIPLQRGGWTLYYNGAKYPKNWKDDPWWGGSWLGTGTGVRAIADTLEILPADAIPAQTRKGLEKVLEQTIAQVMDDWKKKRQWFVRGDNAITNQWILPTVGLVRATLVLGKDRHPQAYKLGVSNLKKTLAAMNEDGSYPEGAFYGKSWTGEALLSIGRAMAMHGDTSVIEHPFFKRFPTWLVLQMQPGHQYVTSFDAIHAFRDGSYQQFTNIMSRIAVTNGDRHARWALTHQIGKVSNDLWGLGAAALPPIPRDEEPPLFKNYDGARALIWRSSWADDADGLWIRGGHPKDQHDHDDRGHVSFTSRGRPILIETGTPYYGHRRMASDFVSGAGHNVLQVGTAPIPKQGVGMVGRWEPPHGWQRGRRNLVAPITAKQLDAKGGQATVIIGAKGYPDLKEWRRTVVWQAGGTVTITDHVRMNKPHVLLFRWHLGTEDKVTLSDTGATWADAQITVAAEGGLKLTSEKRENHVLRGRDRTDPDQTTGYSRHTCLIVTSPQKVTEWTLTTTVKPTQLDRQLPQ